MRSDGSVKTLKVSETFRVFKEETSALTGRIESVEGENDGWVKSLYGVKGCAIMGRLVYKLYGLTAEEIAIVEEPTRASEA